MLDVNRSSYYKYLSKKPSKRTIENQNISRIILEIHGKYKKRLGTYKITHILNRDYGIKISVGRVYRLIKKLNLPTMSTTKSFIKHNKRDIEDSYFKNQLRLIAGLEREYFWYLSVFPQAVLPSLAPTGSGKHALLSSHSHLVVDNS